MAAADMALSAVVGPDGVAVITIMPDPKQTWLIQQVSPELPTALSGATGTIRKNGAMVTPFEPTGDAVGGDPYPVLRLGDRLTVEWTGCRPGDVVRALVMYDDGVVR